MVGQMQGMNHAHMQRQGAMTEQQKAMILKQQ